MADAKKKPNRSATNTRYPNKGQNRGQVGSKVLGQATTWVDPDGADEHGVLRTVFGTNGAAGSNGTGGQTTWGRLRAEANREHGANTRRNLREAADNAERNERNRKYNEAQHQKAQAAISDYQKRQGAWEKKNQSRNYGLGNNESVQYRQGAGTLIQNGNRATSINGGGTVFIFGKDGTTHVTNYDNKKGKRVTDWNPVTDMPKRDTSTGVVTATGMSQRTVKNQKGINGPGGQGNPDKQAVENAVRDAQDNTMVHQEYLKASAEYHASRAQGDEESAENNKPTIADRLKSGLQNVGAALTFGLVPFANRQAPKPQSGDTQGSESQDGGTADAAAIQADRNVLGQKHPNGPTSAPAPNGNQVAKKDKKKKPGQEEAMAAAKGGVVKRCPPRLRADQKGGKSRRIAKPKPRRR